MSRILCKVIQHRYSVILTNGVKKINSVRKMTVSKEVEKNWPSMVDLKMELKKKMLGSDLGYHAERKDSPHLLKYLPESQTELPPRSMNDSFIAGIIPLSTDLVLQDKYITYNGRVRIGRLLEDMDIFAVMVCFKHIVNPRLPPDYEVYPYAIVTVLVDRIDFTDYIPKGKEDIRISGHVSWVGSSSMEAVVWLEQRHEGKWQRITRALFLLAARDADNKKSALVNPIGPANERERSILSGGEDRKRKRQELQKKNLAKVIPDTEEQQFVHDLFIRTVDPTDESLVHRLLPPGCVWMSEAKLSNVIVAQPEDRNLHNTIFGGFIMRQAFELSWIVAYKFSKQRPTIKSISDIRFNRPVAVSSLVQMHSHVTYTESNLLQVTTFTEIFDPLTAMISTTNSFHFTFSVQEKVNEVIPLTYQEAMLYIDGRRHFNEVMRLIPGIQRLPSKM